MDRLLRGERQRLHLNLIPESRRASVVVPGRSRSTVTSEWDREQIGNLQVDFVLHCGQSSAGLFAPSLCRPPILLTRLVGGECHAWPVATWHVYGAWKPCVSVCRSRCTKYISATTTAASLMSWCTTGAASTTSPCHDLGLCKRTITRGSRQRNWTHLRKIVGYRRFDTQTQLDLLDDVYADLALYKKFFQPTTKLGQKQACQRASCIECMKHRKHPISDCSNPGSFSVTACERLRDRTYRSLNPAELKRRIDQHRDRLFATFENTGPKRRPPTRRMTPSLVRSFMTQQGTSCSVRSLNDLTGDSNWVI